MTTKIKFDTARYCANNAGRMGQWQGQDVAGMIGEEMAALKAAARTIANAYTHARNVATWSGETLEPDQQAFPGVTVAQMDELARLVGEE